jgi:hypothetical protein
MLNVGVTQCYRCVRYHAKEKCYPERGPDEPGERGGSFGCHALQCVTLNWRREKGRKGRRRCQNPPKTLSFLKNLSVPRKGKKASWAALGKKAWGKGDKAKISFEVNRRESEVQKGGSKKMERSGTKGETERVAFVPS